MTSKELREQLLNQEITRKQFLQYVSGAVISIVGFSSFISSAINYGNGTKLAARPDSTGDDSRFGTRKFGK